MKFVSTRKSRRHRNPKTGDDKKQPFFVKEPKNDSESQNAFFSPGVTDSGPIQAKLTIGKRGDKYEQEADAVADQVVKQSNNSANIQQGGTQNIQRSNSSKMQMDKEIQEQSAIQKQGVEEEMQEQPAIQKMGEEEMQEQPAIQAMGEEEMQEQPAIQKMGEEEMQEKPAIQAMGEEEMQEQPAIQKMGEEEMQEQPAIQKMGEEEMQEQPAIQAMGEEEMQEQPAIQAMGEEDMQEKPTTGKHHSNQANASGKRTASPTLSNEVKRSRGKGQPLPNKTKSEMEAAFGLDFSKVNIHTNAKAVQMNKEIGAQAFTHGSDIFFDENKFNPETTTGKHLLAHELTHVVQQGKAGVKKKFIQKNEEKDRDVVTEEKDPIADSKLKKEDAAEKIPGLSTEIVKELTELIANKKRKEALNKLVEFLINDGQMDASLLEEGKMHYGGAAGGEGLASPPGYKKDPDTGELKAKPTPVRIGWRAFKNVPLLYSTVMHEYIHVQQFQEPVARGTKGQRGLGWLIKRQEVEAYAYELINADKTGLSTYPTLMLDAWSRLNSEWNGLGKASKKLLNPMYESAYQSTKKVVGDKKIPYKPFK